MPIIIPSKNIYSKKNPKIKNNYINEIYLTDNKVSNDLQEKTPVYDLYLDTSFLKDNFGAWKEKSEQAYDSPVLSAYNYFLRVMVGVRSVYYNGLSALINRQLKNAYVSSLGISGQENYEINHTVIYKKYKGIATKKAYPDKDPELILEYDTDNYETIKSSLPELIMTHTSRYKEDNTELTVTSTITGSDLTNKIPTINNSTTDDYYFGVYISSILCGVEKYWAVESGKVLKEDWDVGTARDWVMVGECEKYEPVGLEITFYGNTIGIKLDEKEKTYGNGIKPFSLETNELFQDNNVSGTLANLVLDKYSNGKETATLLCDINEYYTDKTLYHIKGIKSNNLLPPYHIDFSDGEFEYYNNGIWYLAVKDGTIYASGTVGSDSNFSEFPIVTPENPIIFDEPTTVYLSGSAVAENKENPECRIYCEYYTKGGGIRYTYDSGEGTLLENVVKISEISILLLKDKTFDNIIFKPMLNLGNTSKEFSPPIEMTFKEGDLVIPMILSPQGTDVPMSTSQSGEAKIFEVVGTDFIYDGAVWQRLTLLEH